MNVILFDTELRQSLFPLTLTKAVADIRTGILTAKERWEKITNAKVFVLTDAYLQSLYETLPAENYLLIDASVIPDNDIITSILSLSDKEAIEDKNGLIAGKAFVNSISYFNEIPFLFKNITKVSAVKRLVFPNQIFLWNEEMIRLDFSLLTNNRISKKSSDSVNITNAQEVFIEDGVQINFSSLNAATGPIYIGKNAVIMEGCFIRGPFAACEGAVVKMGAKIYGATTIGPYCTAGGEIKNSVISGHSNKAHDGYLGDSVIGEWCNLGAGTCNSNVKNTGGEIKIWNYYKKDYVPSGNKCGMIMGDYTRTAINTSVNTGTVIGACCNIFGDGLTPTFIPDFSWGSQHQNRYDFQKAVKDIANWKKIKNKTFIENEIIVLKHIFEQSGN